MTGNFLLRQDGHAKDKFTRVILKMRKKIISTIVLSAIFATACKNDTKTMKSTDANAPVAHKEPTKLEKHGDIRRHFFK